MIARDEVMKFVASILMLMLQTAIAGSEETKQIPLDQIWGYRIPKTRDIRELEVKPDLTLPVKERGRRSAVLSIVKELQRRRKDEERPGDAFVVIGPGKSALESALAVLTNAKKRVTVFSPEDQLYIVWFSHSCGRYVWLRNVERTSNEYKFSYQFVAHSAAEVSPHFAIVPIGRLEEGKYHVEMHQIPSIWFENGKQTTPIRNPERVVSNSFSFEVKKD